MQLTSRNKRYLKIYDAIERLRDLTFLLSQDNIASRISYESKAETLNSFHLNKLVLWNYADEKSSKVLSTDSISYLVPKRSLFYKMYLHILILIPLNEENIYLVTTVHIINTFIKIL